MRIVVLAENTSAADKLFAEHGLCLYIEHKHNKILFGTGASAIFIENAKRLGIPLSEVQSVVLAHNHTSCAGGLEAFLKINPSASVYIKKSAATDCAEKSGLIRSRTGLPGSFFKSAKVNCIKFESFSEVCGDFFLVSNEYSDEASNPDKRFFIKRDRKWQHDDFSGETFAVCFPGRRRDGCVILTACSHSGITGIIKTVKKLWDVPVIAVVGGFGFMSSNINKTACSADTVKSVAGELDELDIGYIYTCHCTGIKGYDIMKELLGDQIQYLHTGEELEF